MSSVIVLNKLFSELFVCFLSHTSCLVFGAVEYSPPSRCCKVICVWKKLTTGVISCVISCGHYYKNVRISGSSCCETEEMPSPVTFAGVYLSSGIRVV